MDNFSSVLKKKVTDAKDKLVESSTLSTDKINTFLKNTDERALRYSHLGWQATRARQCSAGNQHDNNRINWPDRRKFRS